MCHNKYMNSNDITSKITTLEGRAASYVANPGPAGEVQQRATGIVANHRVEVILRDGQVHHYEITSFGGMITVARTRTEAVAAIAA